MLQFTTGATGFAWGDTLANLTGKLSDGTDFAGQDTVLIVR